MHTSSIFVLGLSIHSERPHRGPLVLPTYLILRSDRDPSKLLLFFIFPYRTYLCLRLQQTYITRQYIDIMTIDHFLDKALSMLLDIERAATMRKKFIYFLIDVITTPQFCFRYKLSDCRTAHMQVIGCQYRFFLP